MSDFNDRYKRAAGLRLGMTPVPGMLAPGQQPQSPPPASYGNGIMQALEWLGFGNRPPPRPSPAINEPSPFPKGPSFPPRQTAGNYGGAWPSNETPMPPAMNAGPLPPMNADAQQYDDAARYRPQAPAPVAQRPAAPTGADAAFVPPPGWMPPADYLRTMNDADLGGYGGNPGRGAPYGSLAPYAKLNPTPSLRDAYLMNMQDPQSQFSRWFA